MPVLTTRRDKIISSTNDPWHRIQRLSNSRISRVYPELSIHAVYFSLFFFFAFSSSVFPYSLPVLTDQINLLTFLDLHAKRRENFLLSFVIEKPHFRFVLALFVVLSFSLFLFSFFDFPFFFFFYHRRVCPPFSFLSGYKWEGVRWSVSARGSIPRCKAVERGLAKRKQAEIAVASV